MAGFWNRVNRLLRHAWVDESDLHQAIPLAVLNRLQELISASELEHSGEIRVCVEASLPWRMLWRDTPITDIIRERALSVFSELGVWDTDNNNGVLIYVLLAEKDIEIVADRGLNVHVPPEHWQVLIGQMGLAFKDGQFEKGLTQGVDAVTMSLLKHFCADQTRVNPNELPDWPLLR